MVKGAEPLLLKPLSTIWTNTILRFLSPAVKVQRFSKGGRKGMGKGTLPEAPGPQTPACGQHSQQAPQQEPSTSGTGTGAWGLLSPSKCVPNSVSTLIHREFVDRPPAPVPPPSLEKNRESTAAHARAAQPTDDTRSFSAAQSGTGWAGRASLSKTKVRPGPAPADSELLALCGPQSVNPETPFQEGFPPTWLQDTAHTGFSASR